MANELLNPRVSATLGDAVYNWERVIRPALIRGNYIADDKVRQAALELWVKNGAVMGEGLRGWKDGAYQRYQWIIGCLAHLRERPELSEINFFNIDRNFTEIDRIMGKVPEYEEFRRGKETDRPVIAANAAKK